MMLLKTIGQRINKARIDKNWSQLQLSHETNLTQALISGYETDRVLPSEKALKILSKILNVKTSWLRYGEGESEKENEIVEIHRILGILIKHLELPLEMFYANPRKFKEKKAVGHLVRKKNKKDIIY